uniref:Rx N-terminal domain-containing protein n=1 Tax=Oryza brachyantha TaxID=4533 RepID=J3N6T4_ORYBR
MLAGAVLSCVGQRISSVIAGQITLQWDFSDDLRRMKTTLESVAALLEDAEKQSMNEKTVWLWLKRLKDAAYAISDIIDEFEADTQWIQQPTEKMSTLKKGLLQLATMVPCLTVHPKIKLANKVKALRQQLKEITDQHTSFTLNISPSINMCNIPDERATSSTVDKTVIVGRTGEMQIIIHHLTKSLADDFTVFPIYGIGGIGKTTLTKMILSDALFKDYSRVWVYVSQILDSDKIGISTISQLSEEQSHLTEQQMIHNQLAKLLAEKKILIVLDDLWGNDGSKFDKLKEMLKSSKETNIFSTSQLGERYLKELLGLSFLQDLKSSSENSGVFNDDDDDQVTRLTMHDLVHDLAISVMADEFLDGSIQDNANRSNCRYALIKDFSKPLESYVYSPANIKALHFLDCGKIGLHEVAFSSAKNLRVLDISECCIQRLPDSIGDLKQLRYLNAPGVRHERIPDCITKLFKLMYLSFHGSSAIKALPESIGEMNGLMYLDLSDCSSIEKLPGSFGKLVKLVHLNLSKCSQVSGGVSESFESPHQSRIFELI